MLSSTPSINYNGDDTTSNNIYLCTYISAKYLTRRKANNVQKPRRGRNEGGLSKIKNMMMKKKLC